MDNLIISRGLMTFSFNPSLFKIDLFLSNRLLHIFLYLLVLQKLKVRFIHKKCVDRISEYSRLLTFYSKQKLRFISQMEKGIFFVLTVSTDFQGLT